MKIQEAIDYAKIRDLWFRPSEALGFAYCIKHDPIYLVPFSRGGVLAHIVVSDILGEWEIVEPNTVIHEKETL